MVTRIHRFDFGGLRDFRGPIVVEALKQVTQEETPPPPPAPVFSQEELEAARLSGKREGYAEGFLAGQQDAKNTFDAKTSEAQQIIHSLGEQLSGLRTQYASLLTQESSQLAGLVLAIARKVAGEALAADSSQVILGLVEQCLPVIFTKPKLVLELNPGVFDATLDRIEQMLREGGVEAEIQFRANADLHPSDIKLDWGSGQIQRSTAELWHEIEQMLAQVSLVPTETLQTITQE